MSDSPKAQRFKRSSPSSTVLGTENLSVSLDKILQQAEEEGFLPDLSASPSSMIPNPALRDIDEDIIPESGSQPIAMSDPTDDLLPPPQTVNVNNNNNNNNNSTGPQSTTYGLNVSNTNSSKEDTPQTSPSASKILPLRKGSVAYLPRFESSDSEDSEDTVETSSEQPTPRKLTIDMSNNPVGNATPPRPSRPSRNVWKPKKDYHAEALKRLPQPMSRPIPFENPTQDQYKQYMRERYEFEQWENSVLLLSRKLEAKDRRKHENKQGVAAASTDFEPSQATLRVGTMELFSEKEIKSDANPLLGATDSQDSIFNLVNNTFNNNLSGQEKKVSGKSDSHLKAQSVSPLGQESDRTYVSLVADEVDKNYEKASSSVKKQRTEFFKERQANEKILIGRHQSQLKKLTRNHKKQLKEHNRLIDEQQHKKNIKDDQKNTAFLKYEEDEPPTVKRFRQLSETKMNQDILHRSQTRMKLSELHDLQLQQKEEVVRTQVQQRQQSVKVWLDQTLEFQRIAQEAISKSLKPFSISRHKSEQDALSHLETAQKKKCKVQLEKNFPQKDHDKTLKKETKEREKELEKQGKSKKEVSQLLQDFTSKKNTQFIEQKKGFEDLFNKQSKELIDQVRKRYESADQAEQKKIQEKEGLQAKNNFLEIREFLKTSSAETSKVIEDGYNNILKTAKEQYEILDVAILQDYEIDLSAMTTHFDKTYEIFEKESSREIERVAEKKKIVTGTRKKAHDLHSVYKNWSDTHDQYRQQATDSLEMKMFEERTRLLYTYCELRENLEVSRFIKLKELQEHILGIYQTHCFPIWRKSIDYTVGSEEKFITEYKSNIQIMIRESVLRGDKLKETAQAECLLLEKEKQKMLEKKQETKSAMNESTDDDEPLSPYSTDNKEFSTTRYDKFLLPPAREIGFERYTYDWNYNYTFVDRSGESGANGLNVGEDPEQNLPTPGQRGQDAVEEETLYLNMRGTHHLTVTNSRKEVISETTILPANPVTSTLNPPILKIKYCGGTGGVGGAAHQGLDQKLPPEAYNGADGGDGGNGCNITIVSQHLHLFQLVEIDVSGGKGGAGGLGNDQGQPGKPGLDGLNGSILYRYESSKGVMEGDEIFKATILDFQIVEDFQSLDTIVEPTEHITVNNIRIGNTGKLPLPAGSIFYFRSTQMISMEPAAVVLPEIPPGQEILIPSNFSGLIADANDSQGPLHQGPFIRVASVLGVVACANIPFKEGCLIKTIQVRYPLCFDKIVFPSQLAARECGSFEVILQNISTRPYAKPDEKATRAALWIHFPKGLTPITRQPLSETSIGKVLKFPLQTLDPDSAHTYKVDVVCDKSVQLFDRLTCRAEIWLRGKMIEYRELPVRVSVPYYTSYKSPGDILLVTPPEFTRSDYLGWKAISENLGLRMDIWDLEHQRGLSSHLRHKSWVGQYTGKVVVAPTLLPGTEFDLVHHLLSPDPEQALTEMQLKNREEEEKNKSYSGESSFNLLNNNDVGHLINYDPKPARYLPNAPSTFALPNRNGPPSGLLLLTTMESEEIVERLIGASNPKTEKLSDVLTQPPNEDELSKL